MFGFNSLKKFAAALSLAVLALSGEALAEIKTQVIEYRDGGTTLQGYLAYDDASKEKRPGVLVIPEWWGLTAYPKARAEQLAKLGYVAFAVDMYGNGQTTRDPQQAGAWATPFRSDRNLMRSRAAAGLSVLLNHQYVDAKKVAAIGYCFGGTGALELARAGANVIGVVSFHGDLSAPLPSEAGKLKAKVLVCHGADDPMVKPESVDAFQKEMKTAKADYQVNVYSGAVHAFTNREADSFHIPGIGYNAEADARSFEAMKAFFIEIFR